MDKDRLVVSALEQLVASTGQLQEELADVREAVLATRAALTVTRAALVMAVSISGGDGLAAVRDMLLDQEVAPGDDRVLQAQAELLGLLMAARS